MPQAAGLMPQARAARANVAVSAALLQHVSRIGPPPLPMNTLLLKLIVTPVLIGAASLAGRRWGETLSGWFIGLPLTSGPVCWFLAIEQGTGFAAAAARGCLAGAAAEAGFCLAYAIAARKCGWICSLAAGTLAFATGAALFQIAHPALWMLALIVYAALTTALLLMPELATGRAGFPEPPAWDLPARMAVATALVLGLTGIAPLLGAQLSGMLATYPIFGAVLAAFAHRQSGAAAAGRVLRGLLIGLFGFTGFFLCLALAIEPLGIAASFAAATALALSIQGVSLWVGPVRRPRR
jgi:hypothetical protein